MSEVIHKLLKIIDELEDSLGPAGYEIISEVFEEYGLDREKLNEEF